MHDGPFVGEIGSIEEVTADGFLNEGDDISVTSFTLVTRELVATEIVRALVGSIGLVASVPIATWLAALFVTGPPDDAHLAATDSEGI